jgi:pyridoxamine 5'-phosphate oxidase family protein
MSSFTSAEVAYISTQPLARLATVGPGGQPDVSPVVFEFDGTDFWIGGRDPERTRKFRNVAAGNLKVSLVIDDLASRSPWAPRFLRVYGLAQLQRRTGAFGAGQYLRIRPEMSWSWNLDGLPYSGTNNSDIGTRKTVHQP